MRTGGGAMLAALESRRVGALFRTDSLSRKALTRFRRKTDC